MPRIFSPATPNAPTADEVANLENMTNTFNITSNDKAFGGRLGLWWPEVGLEGGLSGMYSGDYLAVDSPALHSGGPDCHFLSSIDLDLQRA